MLLVKYSESFLLCVAESLGLPMIPPFLHSKGRDSVAALRQGVNYAVAGATALDSSFLEAKWTEKTVINASLQVQLDWFKQSLPSICGHASGNEVCHIA